MLKLYGEYKNKRYCVHFQHSVEENAKNTRAEAMPKFWCKDCKHYLAVLLVKNI